MRCIVRHVGTHHCLRKVLQKVSEVILGPADPIVAVQPRWQESFRSLSLRRYTPLHNQAPLLRDQNLGELRYPQWV